MRRMSKLIQDQTIVLYNYFYNNIRFFKSWGKFYDPCIEEYQASLEHA